MSVQTSAPRTSRSTSKALAITVAAGPVLLLGALLWHPPLPGRLPDNDAVAEAAAADVTRWGLSHLAAAFAAAAVSVAFIVIRSYLRERGDGWFSAVGLALVVVGNTLYAVLPGMEFSALAAHETGTDIAVSKEYPVFRAVDADRSSAQQRVRGHSDVVRGHFHDRQGDYK